MEQRRIERPPDEFILYEDPVGESDDPSAVKRVHSLKLSGSVCPTQLSWLRPFRVLLHPLARLGMVHVARSSTPAAASPRSFSRATDTATLSSKAARPPSPTPPKEHPAEFHHSLLDTASLLSSALQSSKLPPWSRLDSLSSYLNDPPPTFPSLLRLLVASGPMHFLRKFASLAQANSLLSCFSIIALIAFRTSWSDKNNVQSKYFTNMFFVFFFFFHFTNIICCHYKYIAVHFTKILS